MHQDRIVVFVCEHGAAKSILAAAYFNRLAYEMGLDLKAIARGTNPDHELSPQTLKGLSEDGLAPTESVPKRLTGADIQNSQRVITFCELPIEFQGQVIVERWDDIPPVSENYEKARERILERLDHLLTQVKSWELD